MLVKIFSGAVNGIEATTITLEVNILNGAKFIIVGLPDNAVKESQQRIDSALREIGSRYKTPGKYRELPHRRLGENFQRKRHLHNGQGKSSVTYRGTSQATIRKRGPIRAKRPVNRIRKRKQG